MDRSTDFGPVEGAPPRQADAHIHARSDSGKRNKRALRESGRCQKAFCRGTLPVLVSCAIMMCISIEMRAMKHTVNTLTAKIDEQKPLMEAQQRFQQDPKVLSEPSSSVPAQLEAYLLERPKRKFVDRSPHLPLGARIAVYEAMKSPDGRVAARMQDDCHFVIYRKQPSYSYWRDPIVLWASDTQSKGRKRNNCHVRFDYNDHSDHLGTNIAVSAEVCWDVPDISRHPTTACTRFASMGFKIRIRQLLSVQLELRDSGDVHLTSVDPPLDLKFFGAFSHTR